MIATAKGRLPLRIQRGTDRDMAKLDTMIEHQRQDPASGFRFVEYRTRDKPVSGAVLVYLHGSGERGADVSWVKRYGLPALLDRSQVSVNCTVMCPQLEADAIWEAARVARFITALTASVQKVVLMGFSLGGSGVCEVVSRYGPLVDAAVAIAGQAPNSVQVAQQGTRFFAIQGELDPWPCTSDFVASVNASGGVAHGVTLQGKGHYISEDALFHPELGAVLCYAGIAIQALGDRAS